jgi:HPt (histidine-containing phosphotransfer) domain-containing protein
VSDALTSSTSAAEDRPPIDPATFAALVEMTGGEMDFVDELVDTFLEDGSAQIEGMRAALAEGDTERLGRAAHSLKSSSLNVGALDLGATCRSLEEAARTGVVPEAEVQVGSIATAFGDVRRALFEERERRAPG